MHLAGQVIINVFLALRSTHAHLFVPAGVTLSVCVCTHLYKTILKNKQILL